MNGNAVLNLMELWLTQNDIDQEDIDLRKPTTEYQRKVIAMRQEAIWTCRWCCVDLVEVFTNERGVMI